MSRKRFFSWLLWLSGSITLASIVSAIAASYSTIPTLLPMIGAIGALSLFVALGATLALWGGPPPRSMHEIKRWTR